MGHQSDITVDETRDTAAEHCSVSGEAEQEMSTKEDKGALWLLLSVVLMTAATLWMVRDIWTTKPVVDSSDAPANATNSVTTQRLPPVEPSKAGQDAEAQDRLKVFEQQQQEGLLAAKQQAADNELQRREVELQLEQERVARAALEKQQVETEKRLAEERLAIEQARTAAEEQLESERLALEQARIAAEEQLESERLVLEQARQAAEEKLARERAERAALERRAALEKQRVREARLKAEQAERERLKASEALQAERERLKANEALRAEQARIEEAASDTPTAASEHIPAHDMQDSAGEILAGTADFAETDDAESADPMDSKFSSNPCDGPSAKFLSTCR